MTDEVRRVASPLIEQLGLAPKRDEVDTLMKRCQTGVGGRPSQALENAHSILAECYGTLGRQQLEIERLRAALDRAIAMLQRLEFSVDTHQRTGKDTLGCPCCEGGCIVGLSGKHREGCELACLLSELAP